MITKSKTEIKTSFLSKTILNKKLLFAAPALLMLTIFIVGKSTIFNAMLAGTITGTVFQDFNGNGNFDTSGGTADLPTAVDVGVAGVTVTAYDSAGAAQGSTTTTATGAFSLSATGTGPYRIEFTTLPAGFQPSARSTDSVTGGTATNSGSTVQFVADGNTANVNLAINRPEEYCQNNPDLVTCRFNQGAQNGTFATNPAIQRFPTDAGTVYTDTVAANYDVPTAATIAQASTVGSVYGLAYRRSTQRVYASAFYRRFAGFGPGANGTYDATLPSTTSDDSSAIYVLNPANGAVAATFTVPNAATNSHTTTTAADTTNASWDAVGKSSLGGIALADDESRLFVMNLQNKTLYALDPTSGANLASQAVPTPGTCPAADVRPFAVKFYRGSLYVGMVCSAESTQVATNLRAYVYQVDPATLAFGATPYTFSLNYNRGFNEPAQNGGATTFPAEWRPWTATIVSETGVYTYPQPMLTDIEIDNGNMILGLRDRLGDQGQDIGFGGGYRPAGEVLRACGSLTNFPANLTLEANGRCGGTGTAPQNTGQGPGAAPGTATGSGEFYFNDDFSTPANSVNPHDEVLSGALLRVPGYAQTVSTAFDPISRATGLNETFDQGFRWLDGTSGTATKAYRLFNGDGQTSTGGEFGKVNGLGDVIALCDSAPIEIGNRVWNDTNGNGVQDPGETGIAGVTVELYNGATPVTYVRYRDEFDNIAYNGTNGSADWSGTPWTEIGDDGVVNAGQVQAISSGSATFGNGLYIAGDLAGINGASRAISLTSAGTLSFNYFRQGIGVSVEYSTNGGTSYTSAATFATATDAAVLTGTAAIPANATNIRFVTNSLLATSNYVYIDNVQITTNATVTTDANGEYYFSSLLGTATGTNAAFGANIQPNTAYQLRFSGTPISTLSVTAPNATAQLGNDDSNDSDVIRSGGLNVINFTTGAAGSNDHTQDAGFSTTVSIGSTVFNDVNNDGLFNAGETGIGGVLVELLYDADNNGVISGTELTTPLASITTSSAAGSIGNYFFNGLIPGNYQVRIPTPPAAATLSSAPAVTDTADNQQDNDDNGIQTGGAGGSTISPLITLLPNTEPTNTLETGQGNTQDDADDDNGDMTVDFGFLAPASVGNRVWIDTNANGIQDAGETAGLDGVTVTLYDGNGTAIATTTTAGGGLYSFTGLFPGTYSVGFTRPFGYGFSPQDAAGSTEANDSDVSILTGRTATFTLAAGQNNVDIDAGVFQSVSLGNRVWFDANNNGSYDAGETFFSGTTVNLYLDANNDGAPDGAAVRTTTTDTNGVYLFDGLAPNTYIVGVVTPTNFVRSSVNGGDPDNNIDNDNNGVIVSGNETRSNPVTLALGTEPTGETPNDTTTTADNSGNLTVDFGFTRGYSLGNRVWFDTNNNGQINAGEVGIAGVSVSLFASGDLTTALQTLTTDASGYYRFDNLTAGSYVVRINPSNFATGGALAGYQNTTGNTAANVDSTATLSGEDGINPTGAANTVLTNGILSNVKTITINTTAEPTGEGDVQASGQGTADNQANMTIDFGFYRLSLSGTIWNDTGAGVNTNNGILDAGEVGISNVVVLLYDSAGVEIPVGQDGILGTADDAVGGMLTNASGTYNFQGLAPGDYRVGVNTTRTGNPSTPNAPNPNNDVDNDNNGTINAAFPQRVVSGLVTLAPGSEPSVTNATGTSLNTTVDFGFVLAPTLVSLDTFEVFSDNDGLVTVKWATAAEDDNLGFNVYREVGGNRELINASPIIGTALRSKINLEAKSAGYSWTDVNPVDGAVYYLEDIDLKGTRTIHGPVSPVAKDSGSSRTANPRLLSDLAALSRESKQVDSIAKVEAAARKAARNDGNRQQQLEVAARGGVKIAVKNEGWYRISLGELQNAGFELNSDPNNWQLFRNGEEIPFRFGADNSVEFYGHGLDLPETDKQTYYLTVGKTAGQRLAEEAPTELVQRSDAASFRNTATIKGRSVYFPSILNGDKENWFGAIVSPGGTVNQNLAVHNPHQSGQALLKVRLQGVGNVAHVVSLNFNNFNLGTVTFDGYANQTFEFNLPMSAIVAGGNRVTLTGAGSPSDYAAVDEINLTYERKFTARDNKLTFRVPAGNTVKVDGFEDGNISVIELNDSRAVRRFAVQSEETKNGFAFSLNAAGYDREFIAVANAQAARPVSVVRNNPSRLNSPKNEAQFIIVAPEIFREAATNLANIRRQEGFETIVVPVEDVFDEFSFGRTSAAAIREFLQTTQSWGSAPNFVLLFGDTSYDARNYLAQPDRNLVPTKLIDTQGLETSSDAWLADFNDDGIEDISVGRLPAGTEAEAAQLVGKLTRPARTEGVREERSNLFVADSGFDANADGLRAALPAGIASNIIRRSAMDTQQTRDEVINQTNSGQSVITYFGHGSSVAWSNSGFFRATDTTSLTNGKLAFYLLMTCLNGYAVDPGSDSLAEALIKSENGALAVWSSSGVTHTAGQDEISRAATDLIFNRSGKPLRIGEIVRLSKAATQDGDIRKTWVLIGDPTMFVR